MSCRCLGPEGYLTTLGNQGDLAIELANIGIAGETKTSITSS